MWMQSVMSFVMHVPAQKGRECIGRHLSKEGNRALCCSRCADRMDRGGHSNRYANLSIAIIGPLEDHKCPWNDGQWTF